MEALLRLLSLIAIDYSFLGSSGQETEGTMLVLNANDMMSGKTLMEVVPRKGNHNYAVNPN